jgi:catechol 2,3-dioxygenase-like lactoylglutathione lyase family enzyme
MFAEINHIAMISPQWPMLARFYEALFGLRASSGKSRPLNGVTVGDGRVGLNINPRRDHFAAGLDHFGFVVDDVALVEDRLRTKYPKAQLVKRPSTRPFAAFSGADPDGNVFDLAQRKNDTRSQIYADQATENWQQDRYFNKYALRTVNADDVAAFYADLFELTPVNSDVKGHHLSDGRVTLSILPWAIEDFLGTANIRPGPDHIGFRVESIAALQADLQSIAGLNFHFAPVPLGGSTEADLRKELFARSATGTLQMADPEGNWIDITEAA